MLINRKDEEDFVKVLDFGISKTLDIDTRPQAPGPDEPRRRRGHARLHVARAGGGHARRRAHRRLRRGRPALRDADRGPAVRRRQHPGRPQQEGDGGSAPAARAAPRCPARRRSGGHARAVALRRGSPAVDGDAQGRPGALPGGGQGRREDPERAHAGAGRRTGADAAGAARASQPSLVARRRDRRAGRRGRPVAVRPRRRRARATPDHGFSPAGRRAARAGVRRHAGRTSEHADRHSAAAHGGGASPRDAAADSRRPSRRRPRRRLRRWS